jgi:hypothetical protein
VSQDSVVSVITDSGTLPPPPQYERPSTAELISILEPDDTRAPFPLNDFPAFDASLLMLPGAGAGADGENAAAGSRSTSQNRSASQSANQSPRTPSGGWGRDNITSAEARRSSVTLSRRASIENEFEMSIEDIDDSGM